MKSSIFLFLVTVISFATPATPAMAAPGCKPGLTLQCTWVQYWPWQPKVYVCACR